jgi:hypothetical protein
MCLGGSPGRDGTSLDERQNCPTPAFGFSRYCVATALCVLPLGAKAALYDEIQVYDDSINARHAVGLELHVNSTPSGRSEPDYPGEIPPAKTLRTTAEFSYGLTDALEAGFYVPTLIDQDHDFHIAGAKLRLKWLPVRGKYFWGVNVELSKVAQKFEASTASLELRPIWGYRDAMWLFAINPVLDYNLSPGYRTGGPDFSPQIKLARNVARGLAVGIETYSDIGKLAHASPASEQSHTLYVAVDVDRAPWVFNFGIGRGLTAATDRWTVKAIFELPLSR